MRIQFGKYHQKWMKVFGAIMGGYKGMMPHYKRAFKNRDFKKFKRFPKLTSKLIRLHQMRARHEAFKHMMMDAQTNQTKIALLERKLAWMKEKFELFKNKTDYLQKMSDIKDKKIGKNNIF